MIVLHLNFTQSIAILPAFNTNIDAVRHELLYFWPFCI